MLTPTSYSSSSFFFSTPAPTELYTLSLHDALPISARHDRPLHQSETHPCGECSLRYSAGPHRLTGQADRKSTRLNSSHVRISYAVFCLKKKNQNDYAPATISFPAVTPHLLSRSRIQ